MAVADRTIDPKILESARTEFLSLGFKEASLKNICMKAGVTTGALYKRYSGKDELFEAVVKQTMEDLEAVVAEKNKIAVSQLTDRELVEAWQMDEAQMMWWLAFLYERYDDFVLLLRASSGSSYQDFANNWVEQMNEATYSYYEEAYRRGIVSSLHTKEEMHILISAYWTTIYEPFIHGMKWEAIKKHCKIVCKFFNWYEALEFNLPLKGDTK